MTKTFLASKLCLAFFFGLCLIAVDSSSVAAKAAPTASAPTAFAADAVGANARSARGLARASEAGRLVLLVVVDQLRYQDLLWVLPELGPKGFAGLGRPVPLRYDTVVTETAADHAVLATGAYADLNGIPGNFFWDGEVAREAVFDKACPVWRGPEGLGKSAQALRVPTVGDAFKLGTNGEGRVVSVAVKDRSALFLAGASADLALWFEPETGEMTSSVCYAKSPPGWVSALAREHPLEEWKEWVWKPSRSEEVLARYAALESEGVAPHPGFGKAFPHPVGAGKSGKELAFAVRASPASTTIALRAAQAAVSQLHLGDSGKTDLFLLALSAVDAVGHQFGTTSRERVDTILRMHDELTAFLDPLRTRLGKRLSIVLTADHGLTPIALDERRLKLSAGGTIDLDELIGRINEALLQSVGPRDGGWVASVEGSALSLRKPYPARALTAAVQALRQEPGLWKAVTEDELPGQESSLRHAYAPGRSGSVLIVPRPLWTLKKHADGADHGSPWNDDALVPFLWQTPGFSERAVLRGATLQATQIAPTLAALLGTAPPAAALADPILARDE